MGLRDKFKAGMDEGKATNAKVSELQSLFPSVEKVNSVKYMLGMQAAVRLLEDGEKVFDIIGGEYEGEDANGVMCLTDRRIIIGWSKRGAPGTITVRYENVDEVQSGVGWTVGGWVRIQHGSHSYKIEKSAAREKRTRSFADAIRQKVDEVRDTGSVSAPVVQQSSGMDELAKAAELHKSGVLTDEEFAAIKARVLGS